MNRTRTALTLLLLAALIASCGESGAQEDTPPQSDDVTTTAAPEETQFAPDSLPDDLDLGGKTVNIVIEDYMNAFLEDMYAEEETGNRLSDAVYNVITGVEDRLSVNLEYTWQTCSWAEMQTFQQQMCANILAGDDTCDLLFDVGNYAAQMLEGEYFANLAEMKYIDLDKPWYNQTVRENIYSDYVHFVTGDFALANTKNTFAIYVNQDLYASLGKTEDLYALVDDGKWTFDAMESILKDTYADLNGDTKADENDRYGLTFGDANKYLGFNPALGGKVFEKDGDGYKFVFGNERMVDIVQSMCSLINENENVLPGNSNAAGFDAFQTSSGGGNYMSKLFLEGRAMMSCSLVADAAMIIPEIDFAYGLLPYPKWDEAQENYQTILQRSCYALVPVTCKDTDAASAVLEALSSASHRTLLPEYCEVSLKVRYSQDDDVARMFDLIRSSVTYEGGEIYGLSLGTPTADFREQIKKNDPNWASHVDGKKAAWIEKMEKIAPVS